VHEKPGQPREEAGDMKFAEIGYGCGAPNGGKTAFVPVMKWRASCNLIVGGSSI
jgi:hypothetical protein